MTAPPTLVAGLRWGQICNYSRVLLARLAGWLAGWPSGRPTVRSTADSAMHMAGRLEARQNNPAASGSSRPAKPARPEPVWRARSRRSWSPEPSKQTSLMNELAASEWRRRAGNIQISRARDQTCAARQKSIADRAAKPDQTRLDQANTIIIIKGRVWVRQARQAIQSV